MPADLPRARWFAGFRRRPADPHRPSPGANRPRGRRQITVFRLLLLVAVIGLGLSVVTEQLRNRARVRFEHCLRLSEWHARAGLEYRQNARGNTAMLRIADWHDHMSAEFGRLSSSPRAPVPPSQPFPPEDWTTSQDDSPAPHPGKAGGS